LLWYEIRNNLKKIYTMKDAFDIDHTETVEVLNELAELNMDRILGYELAISELGNQDADLKILFAILVGDSYQYLTELEKQITALDHEMITGSYNSGKIYRRWMDRSLAIKIIGRKAVLSGCEFIEDEIKNGYEAVLDQSRLSDELRSIILDQKKSLKMSHTKIKELCILRPWMQESLLLRTSA
jgi:uncharacterized protein (TIGR02284 family)